MILLAPLSTLCFHTTQESGEEVIGEEIMKICPKVPLVLKIIGIYLTKRTTQIMASFRDQVAANSSFYVYDQIMHTFTLRLDNNFGEKKR